MKKVVVAEDDSQMRLWIAGIVEEMGFCCLLASNGIRALHLLEDNPDVALLITDSIMPELNGEELVGIVQRREETRKVPIIYISAIRRYEEVRRLTASGVNRFLSKPLDPLSLRQAIEEHMVVVSELELSHA